MASLTMLEKSKLEELLGMASGYVLNFSDRTFGDLFVELGDIDIHSAAYQGSGTSKAKKLREYWRIESDHAVGSCLEKLIEHYESYVVPGDPELVKICKGIVSRLLSGTAPLNTLKGSSHTFNRNYISRQIKRMESSIETDPELVIGTAKELIESCCKTVLAERKQHFDRADDIPKLTKATMKVLDLVPEGVNDSAKGAQVIKRLLSNLGTIGHGLAELRGLYGTGHGKYGSAGGLSARHAKLAAGSAATLVTFLFDTHEEKV